MSYGKEDLKDLTLAIALLAGISAFLAKLIGYSNENIINPITSVFIRLLVFLLILEIAFLVLFLLVKGYLIWPLKKEKTDLLKNLSGSFGKMMFFLPIFILFYVTFAVTFAFITKDRVFSDTTINLLSVGMAIISLIVTVRIGGLDFESLKKVMLINQKFEFTHFKMITGWLFIIAYIFIIFAFIVCIFQTSTFLLCGSYAIEINHLPDVDTDIMALTIKDTGIPSGRCYVFLNRLNNSSDGLFQQLDNVTLQDSENKTSKYKYMIGQKEYGVYYLFINTSNLSPGYYLLHAETSYYNSESFNLFEPKKEDNELFYLPARNKSQNVLN